MDVAVSPVPEQPVPPAAESGPAAPPGPTAGRLLLSRLVSLALFAGLVTVLLQVGLAVWEASDDAVVTPLVLSPDSEAVVENRLAIGRLATEREALAARLEESRALLAAEEEAARLLGPISESLTETASRRKAGLDLLRRQREEIATMLEAQEQHVADLTRALSASLIRRSDLLEAETALHQLRLARLTNERDILAGEELIAQAAAEAAKLQIEISRQESQRRGRVAQHTADEEGLRRVDDLLAQLRGRPTSRAADSVQHLAFVPYKELEKVTIGASVRQCRTWGILRCRAVGTVDGMLAGEVTGRDAGDRTTRGLYAILRLTEPQAAHSRVLRIRGAGGAAPAAAGGGR